MKENRFSANTFEFDYQNLYQTDYYKTTINSLKDTETIETFESEFALANAFYAFTGPILKMGNQSSFTYEMPHKMLSLNNTCQKPYTASIIRIFQEIKKYEDKHYETSGTTRIDATLAFIAKENKKLFEQELNI